MLNTPAFSPWRISLTVLHAVVICMTVLRILYRHLSRQLWYDDYVAMFSLVWDCILLSALQIWTRSVPNGNMFSRHITIIFYWLGFIAYISVLWSARISLALALARIFPPKQSVRQLAVRASWVFALISAVLLIQFIIACGHNTSWYQSTQVQCKVPIYMGLTYFLADVAADIMLITISLCCLWRAKPSPHQRHLILAGLAAGISTSITGAVYFVFVLGSSSGGPPRRTMSILFSHFMASISLLACNSTALVTFHCQLRKGDDHPTSYVANRDFRSQSNASSLTSVILTEVSISERESMRDREPPHGARYYSEQNLTLVGAAPHKPTGGSASI